MQTMSKQEIYSKCLTLILFALIQIQLLLASGQDASLSSPLNPIKFDDEADYINGQSDGTRIPVKDESKTNVRITDLPIDCAGQVKYFTESEEKSKLPGSVNASLINQKVGHQFASSWKEVPFVVKVTIVHELSQVKCAGALIHPQWVVTSSDCSLNDFHHQESIEALIFISTGTDFGESKVITNTNHRFNRQGKLVVTPNRVGHEEMNFKRTVTKVVPIEGSNNKIVDSTTLCTPVLLKLSSPFKPEEADTVCIEASRDPFTDSRESKGVSIGWSTYGDSVVQERVMRLTSVKIAPRHCFSSDISPIESTGPLCIKYSPQAHFYLLPGSPVIFIDTYNQIANLYGLACANLSTSLIKSQYVYMQTYVPLYNYAKIIQEYLQPQYSQSDEGINLYRKSYAFSIVSCVNLFYLHHLILFLLFTLHGYFYIY